MSKKAVFFDIDGTIWDVKNYIPPSTIAAIQKLREKGNLAFICSGRSRGYITNKDLLDIGFDGIVSGGGTMVEYHGETVFYHEIEKTLCIRIVETVRKYGFKPILEGKNYLYLDEAEFSSDPYGQKLFRELGERCKSISENYGNWEMSKLSCVTDPEKLPNCQEELSDVLDFIVHNPYVAEMVPKGFHKGIGIKKVCEILNIDIEDTYAFGDSVNDIGMFKTCGHSIVMGNGQDVVKEMAEFVTTPLQEDGIYIACQYFGLI